MTEQVLIGWLQDYGAITILVVVLLEYMNLPGFPAGVIMPLAGLWASRGGMSFLFVMAITILAGLLGSWALYFLGRFLGAPLLDRYTRRFPKQKPAIDRAMAFVERRGGWGLFVGKLVPMLRTLISIPAGVLRMDLAQYTLFSLMGVAVWNLVFVGAGYYFGELILPHMMGALA